MHKLIKSISYKIVRTLLKVEQSSDEKIIKIFQIVYNIISNSFQLIILICFSLIFNNLDNFIIMLFIYTLVRSTGKALHFDNFDKCFWWTNVVFGTTILMMYILIDTFNFDRTMVILFYAILNGLSLSQAQSNQLQKIKSLFAYEVNEKTELKRNIDSYLIDNIDSSEVIAAIKKTEDIIGPDMYKIAYQKYKLGMNVEQITASNHYSSKTTIVRKIDAIRLSIHMYLDI